MALRVTGLTRSRAAVAGFVSGAYACLLLVRCGGGDGVGPAEAGVDATVSMPESGPAESATEDTDSPARPD
jgi:hypothetical protein